MRFSEISVIRRPLKILKPILSLPFFLVAACGTGGESDPASPAASRPTLSQRISEQNGYSQDAEGNWAPKIDRRSQFESQRKSAYFKGDVSKKEFYSGTKDYEKKPFWGTKQVERKKFEGNTDGSRFETASKLGEKKSREDNVASKMTGSYETGEYETGSAREANEDQIDRVSDAETDIRRRVYKAPKILDWQEQRSMSVNQTKGLLGRD